MILLEPQNKIITELLGNLYESPGDKINATIADYDGVTYTISSDANSNMVKVSMNVNCYKSELSKYGAGEIMKKEYGSMLVPETDNFDVCLQIDLTETASKKAETIEKVSMLKTNAMAAPFEKAFDAQIAGQPSSIMPVHYRDQEAIYIKAEKDRVTVIFSTVFKDETDKVFGKVFLQEFVDCRRQPALQNAPQVLYTSKEIPMELRNDPSVKDSDNVGYVTFVLFPRHFGTPKQRQATIALIQYFRDYLHYHIKCSKAYMHSRMRAKVDSWMKVLNRAKPDVEDKNKDKKTASGKTFVRKV
eukprot:Partr_v1_DN23892_c0_g1_i1_m63856 putative protein 2 3 complex subunit